MGRMINDARANKFLARHDETNALLKGLLTQFELLNENLARLAEMHHKP
jgi:hypothetical protein